MNISNDALIDTYIKAVQMELDEDFIKILLEEIKARGLEELIQQYK